MSENLHDIDDLFRSAFEKVDDTPGEAVWNNIDQQLDKRKVAFLLKKSRAWRWVAAACLIFSFSMAMYVVQSKITGPPMARKTQSPTKTSNKINGLTVNKYDNQPLKETIDKKYLPGSNNTETTTTNSQQNKSDSTLPNIVDKAAIDGVIRSDNKVAESTRSLSSSIKKLGSKKQGALPDKNEVVGNTAVNKRSGKQKPIPTNTVSAKETALYRCRDNKVVNGMAKDNGSIAASKRPTEEGYKPFYATNTDLAFEEQLNFGLQNSARLSFPAKPNSGLPYDEAALPKQSRKFSPALTAAVFYSPDFSGNHIKEDRPRFREDERSEIKRNEDRSSSSTAGLLLQYGLTKKLSIESGITFSKITTDFKPKTIFARPDDNGRVTFRFTCAAGTSNVSVKSAAQPMAGDSIRVRSSSNSLEYFGVPFTMRYTVKYGKFALQPGVGFSAFFLTNSNIETTIATNNGYERGANSQIQGLKKNYFNGLISLRASYAISKNIALDFMPQVRLGLSPINKQSPVKTNYHSLGLGMGLSFKIL